MTVGIRKRRLGGQLAPSGRYSLTEQALVAHQLLYRRSESKVRDSEEMGPLGLDRKGISALRKAVCWGQHPRRTAAGLH